MAFARGGAGQRGGQDHARTLAWHHLLRNGPSWHAILFVSLAALILINTTCRILASPLPPPLTKQHGGSLLSDRGILPFYRHRYTRDTKCQDWGVYCLYERSSGANLVVGLLTRSHPSHADQRHLILVNKRQKQNEKSLRCRLRYITARGDSSVGSAYASNVTDKEKRGLATPGYARRRRTRYRVSFEEIYSIATARRSRRCPSTSIRLCKCHANEKKRRHPTIQGGRPRRARAGCHGMVAFGLRQTTEQSTVSARV